MLALPLGGCAWLFPNDEGGDGGPPCEDDINGCKDDTSNFMEDPSCPLQGELELELGEGELEFSALAPGGARCGGSAAGIRRTVTHSASRAARAMARCPLWMGSNVPP